MEDGLPKSALCVVVCVFTFCELESDALKLVVNSVTGRVVVVMSGGVRSNLMLEPVPEQLMAELSGLRLDPC